MAEKSAVNQAEDLLESRLAELRPLVDEFHSVERTLLNIREEFAHGQIHHRPKAKSPTPRKRHRPMVNRSNQFEELVTNEPGITVAQAAKRLDIQPNYLYRIAKQLVDEGKLIKKDRAYAAVGVPTAITPAPEGEATTPETETAETV